ncbi:MAG: hypothetical protein CIT01_05620 [Methanobacterium sp. BRmetb2]|jgi:uncharacterized membrane protein|nr:MAG: hypothetical protein CIT01_05620 [Methanobacterium sp. BRmetb2]
MNKNHFITLSLLLLLTFSILSTVAAQDDDDRSYTIPYANIDLYLQENGNLHVKEKLHYSFSGTYNGVYRDIPIKTGQRIENIQINADGAYSTLEVINQGDTQRLKIYLYSNPEKTVPITDRDVDVYIEYDFINVIKIYNDVAELQYKLWGENWEVDVGQVTGNIHLQSSEGVKYWINPPYYVQSDKWQGNILQIKSTNIASGNWFEIRLAIPKDQFSSNPLFAQKIDSNGLPEMERIQQDYTNELNFKTILYSILSVLMILGIFVPIIIYFRYGREPKIDYQAEYERDLPTADPPAMVNAISGKGFSKRIGEPDMDGFRATIMDLINRKYLLIQDIPSDIKEDTEGSISLKINENKDFSKLKYFEADVINFLKSFEEEGIVGLDRLKSNLKVRSNAESFRDSYNLWKDDLKNEFLNDDVMKKIFIRKGDTYLKIFGGLGLVIAAVTFFFTLFDPFPAARYALVSSIVLGVVAIISLVLPQKIAGRWTTYGEEYNAKWHNFKKYIMDFSLIKEYPPESIAIWNKYLVYATALGIADKVRKSMEMTLPTDELARSDIYLFHYYGGYVILSSTLDAGMATATSGDSGGLGGVGGVGGGSGGGGGGAF